MAFHLGFGDMESAICMGLSILRGTLAQSVTLMCTSKNGNTAGALSDAIVGAVGLGQDLRQTNNFQKCVWVRQTGIAMPEKDK